MNTPKRAFISHSGPDDRYVAEFVQLVRSLGFDEVFNDSHKAKGVRERFPHIYPKAELAEARRLIEKHGYWRRKEELEDAEAAAVNW